jgi:hypothetical protein
MTDKQIKFLKKNIGFSKDDFKYFGEHFKNYEEFQAFQIEKIKKLTDAEINNLCQFIQTIIHFKLRHIDFYTPHEHFVVRGVYFSKDNRLMTYSL